MAKQIDETLAKVDPIVDADGNYVKRTKRRVTADMYDFLTFPAAGDEPWSSLDGPFRRNVQTFVARCGRRVPPPVTLGRLHVATWRVPFRIGGEPDDSWPPDVQLDVVEDEVAGSKRAYCDDCRVVGNNPISADQSPILYCS